LRLPPDRRELTVSPEIIEAVRVAKAEGLFYDDDVLKFVADRIGLEPSRELGTACYHAKGILKDEENAEKREALLAEGFSDLVFFKIENGKRYTIRFPTTYVGQSVPVYSQPKNVTAKLVGDSFRLVPKGHSKSFHRPDGSLLIREGWDA